MKILTPITAAHALLVLGCLLSTVRISAAELKDSLIPGTIKAILSKHCVECHSNDSREGDLNLASAEGIQRGGESGSAFNTAAPLKSLLWEKITAGEMPPEDAPRLTAQELTELREWLTSNDWKPWQREQTVTQHDVLPILLLRCATCHGRQQQQGGLDIRSVASLLQGGKQGPAIIPGDPGNSLLLKRIHAEEMPPRDDLAKYSVKPMESQEIEVLERWISTGATHVEIAEDVATAAPDPLVSDLDRDFWAFQSPKRQPTPTIGVPQDGRTYEAVDAFILDQQSSRGLTPSSMAAPSVLIRRLYYDLLGLPPTPDEIQEFLSDYSTHGESTWPRWVDRLLASPRYGEKWGGFWLDAAGYSDSEGVQHSDPVRPYVWRYRDYVIQSWNADKSYAEFLREQLAGDELYDYENASTITDTMYESLVATAFMKLSPDGTFAGITGFVPDRLEVIDDSLEVLSSAVMGLTIRCARCHSHKFDPIPQRDYYRLSAIFKGALDEHGWLQPIQQTTLPGIGVRHLPYVSSEERQLWLNHEAALDSELQKVRDAGGTEEAIKAIQARRQPEPRVRALWDSGDPSPTYLLRRGNYQLAGRLIGPGVPSVLTDGKTSFEIPKSRPDALKTGRRLAFADWLVQPDHPLTARVMVNRLWHHHFGRGIVRTLDDFGRAGSGPSHPALLDWLAIDLQDGDWRLKRIHRKMLTSATWRQASEVTSSHELHDPDNQYWTRMPMRRMDAEELRDTFLLTSGRLSLKRFGPADPVVAQGEGVFVASEHRGQQRRSIYVQKRRTEPLTLLSTFDRPAMSPNCIERTESTVAPQALHLMNNQVVQSLAVALAERIQRNPDGIVSNAMDQAFSLTMGRHATERERAVLQRMDAKLTESWSVQLQTQQPKLPEQKRIQLAQQKSLETICHTLFNSASLLFID